MYFYGRSQRSRRALSRAALAALALWAAPAGADRTAPHEHGDHEASDHEAGDHEASDHEAGDHEAGDHEAGDHEPADRGTGHHASGHDEHGAHAHGHALLGVVLEGDALAVELRAPAVNVVGFEHAPATDAERAAVREALAAFEGGKPLAPAAAGRCEVEHVDAELAGLSEGHGELHVEIRYRCARPERVEALAADRLFEILDGVETIEAQVITETAQALVTLTPSDALIRLAR